MCRLIQQKEITDRDKEVKLNLEERISSNRTIWMKSNLRRVEREKAAMIVWRIHWAKVEARPRRKK